MGYWEKTLERWHKEGLPEDVHIEPAHYSSPTEFFGLDRREGVGVNLRLVPDFEEVTIEETDDYRIYINSEGIKLKELRKGKEQSMPHWLEFPIKNRQNWKEFKKRLNPSSPARYPDWWEDKKRCWKERDYPLSISAPSLYGALRDWIGFENLSVMFYDDPDLVHEMMDFLAEVGMETIHRALDEVDIDYADFWEDMAYKTGPMVSPKIFKEFMLPSYKKVTSFLREHGVDIFMLDSDGNINELIPLWLEGGVNGFWPLEVAAGMDPVALRKKYGKQVLLIGGIDKRVLARDKKAIEKEVMGKVPFLVSQGGYIPSLDHTVPPDVPFENYMYYLQLIKTVSIEPEKYI